MASPAARSGLLACLVLAAVGMVAGQTTQIGQFTGMISTYSEGDIDPCIGSGKEDDVSLGRWHPELVSEIAFITRSGRNVASAALAMPAYHFIA